MKINGNPDGGGGREPIVESLSVTQNGIYTPEPGVDGFDNVDVNVPINGYTEKDVTEGNFFDIVNLNNSASFVRVSMFAGDNTLQTVNLPDCQIINASAFDRCGSLTQVNLPVCSNVGYMAFRNCTALQSINIPECKIVTDQAFVGCIALQSVSLPVCQSLGFKAFSGCTSLEEVTLTMDDYVHLVYNNTLTGTKIASGTGSIYVQANDYDWYISAAGWSSLSDRFVSVPGGPLYLSFSDGLVYGDATVLKNTYATYLNISSSNVIEVNLPYCSSVENNPGTQNWTLTQCSNLKTVKLGSVTSVSTNNFPKNVESVDLPVCETVNGNTFSGCTKLSQVSLPVCSNVVGYGAFQNCTSLQSIDLPACTSIGDSTFYRCTSLSQVSLPVCEYIGNSAFTDTPLESINLPVCENINGGFMYCRNLKTVDLGVCSQIGYNTFYACSSVTTFILRANTVCSINNTNFQAMPLASFYVPASLVDAYKSAYVWTSSRIFPIE